MFEVMRIKLTEKVNEVRKTVMRYKKTHLINPEDILFKINT